MTPAPSLKPDTEYLLIFDLSAITYSGANHPEVISAWPAKLNSQFGQWAQASMGRSVRLTAKLDAEPGFFELVTTNVQGLTIDPERVRSSSEATRTTEDDTFGIFTLGKEPPLVFGRAVFKIRTGNREGEILINLSISKDGRVIDETAGHDVHCV